MPVELISEKRVEKRVPSGKAMSAEKKPYSEASQGGPMRFAKRVILFLGLLSAVGVPLYMASYPYKPGDLFSKAIGIIGSAMMFIGAIFYVVRKKVRKLAHFGKIKDWLDLHILLCLFGPLLIIYHSGYTISAPNSAIAYYSMMIVVGSGVVGRYIYRHFQFSLSGERASLREMNEEIEKLKERIRVQFSDSRKILEDINRFFGMREKKSSGFLHSVVLMIRMDWLDRKLRKEVLRYLKERKYHLLEGSFEEMVLKLISLEKNVSVLESTAKLFSVWHKLHVPFIWILIVTFLIHIAAVMIF